MYNRYIPKDAAYTPVEKKGPERPSSAAPHRQTAPQTGGRKQGGAEHGPRSGPFRLPAFLSAKEGGGLSGLLKGLRLDDLDSGDILLLLIMLYLLVEGDDLELVIALGLVLIMGLGDKEEEGT